MHDIRRHNLTSAFRTSIPSALANQCPRIAAALLAQRVQQGSQLPLSPFLSFG
jgi:hypothetical protein